MPGIPSSAPGRKVIHEDRSPRPTFTGRAGPGGRHVDHHGGCHPAAIRAGGFQRQPDWLDIATTFTASLATGDQAAFSWDFGDGSVESGQYVTHTYSAAGVYTAIVTASNAVSQASAATHVEVIEPSFELYLPSIHAGARPPAGRPAVKRK